MSISDEGIEAASEWIAREILRTSWDGLNGQGERDDVRVGDEGFQLFSWSNYGSYTFQGRKEDVRDMARAVAVYLKADRTAGLGKDKTP